MLRGRRKETLKQLHRQLREDAIAYWNDKVKDVVQVKDDSRRLYPALKCLARMRKGTHRKDDLSIDCVMIADETTKAATFRRHFEEAYTPQTDRSNATSQLPEGSNFRLDIDQVQKAVKSQSNERAVGVCGIPSELYKFGSTNLHRCLKLLFNLMLSTMAAPRDFTTSILVSIFKTGKPRGMCSTFQPVSFLCTARKVMTSDLLSASRPEFDNFIGT